jgi:hypothetical protein
VASVKKLRATGAVIQEEPQGGINVCTIDLQDVTDLPGLRSTIVRSKLEKSRLQKCAPDITQLLGGETLSRLAAMNITVEGGSSSAALTATGLHSESVVYWYSI